MKLNKKKIVTKIFLYSGIGSVVFFLGQYINGLYQQSNYPGNVEQYLISEALATIIATAVILESLLFINRKIDKKYSWLSNSLKRFWLQLFVDFIFTISSVSVILIIFDLLHWQRWPLINEFVIYNSMGVVITVIVVSFDMLVFFIKRWKLSIIKVERFQRETEKLEKENIRSQYEALKNQINPHFLFNSLTALSSIIPTEPEKSVEFVSRFTKIYRYVLDMKDKTAVELIDELKFIESYIFLQKIRFNENLVVRNNVEAAKYSFLIPPLTIQLLLENAIKHNEISSSYPLEIEISNKSDWLIIRNKLRPINVKTDSTSIGQKNLKERYSMISERIPEFIKTQNEYIAKVPLLTED